MTSHAKPFPSKPHSPVRWGGIALTALVIGLWMNSSFDRFLFQAGLDDFIFGTCFRTLADTVFCGGDEIGNWCREFGKLSAENRAICAGR